MSSPWFSELWPITFVKDTEEKLENDKTGFMEAMAFASITGSRGDRVRVDDPLSVEGGNSTAPIRETRGSFQTIWWAHPAGCCCGALFTPIPWMM